MNPFRLDRSESITCDMKHDYTNEQRAYNGGLVNKFVESTSSSYPGCHAAQVTGYFDGNTVTALWNYAQHYSLNDNFLVLHLDLQLLAILTSFPAKLTATPTNIKNPKKFDVTINDTLIGNLDPAYDICSRNYGAHNATLSMEDRNVGNLLDLKNVTWGWFSAGFRLDDSRDQTLYVIAAQAIQALEGFQIGTIILQLNHFNITTLLQIHTIFSRLQLQ